MGTSRQESDSISNSPHRTARVGRFHPCCNQLVGNSCQPLIHFGPRKIQVSPISVSLKGPRWLGIWTGRLRDRGIVRLVRWIFQGCRSALCFQLDQGYIRLDDLHPHSFTSSVVFLIPFSHSLSFITLTAFVPVVCLLLSC
jgi:hypothetical protein